MQKVALLYYAYGSNMLFERIKKRIPRVKKLGVGKLEGYLFLFNKISKDGSGKGNILPNKSNYVLGVLYEIGEDEFLILDLYERGYKRELVNIISERKTIEAITYISDRIDDKLKPTKDYFDLVIEGAKENNFGEEYILYLQSLLY